MQQAVGKATASRQSHATQRQKPLWGSNSPPIAARQLQITTPALPAQHRHMTTPLHWQPSTPRRTASVARVFDNLKKWIPGSSSPVPGQTGSLASAGSDSEGAGGEAEEGEGEEEEMLRLDRESGGLSEEGDPFGPLAILLVGFQADELEAFRQLMATMDADMVKLIPCTQAMLSGSLQEAVECEQVPAFEQPPLGTRRTIFLSGMYGAEVVDTVASYRESGLPPAVFAAAVPRNYGRSVAELAEDAHKENAIMRQRAQEAMLRQQAHEQMQASDAE